MSENAYDGTDGDTWTMIDAEAPEASATQGAVEPTVRTVRQVIDGSRHLVLGAVSQTSEWNPGDSGADYVDTGFPNNGDGY